MWIATTLFAMLLQAGPPPLLEFPATGDPRAHAEFVLGIIALHGSAYDAAAGHFRAAQSLDPSFVMAYWGEAMTFNHPFWNQQDIAGARRALLKLGATRTARTAKAQTTREGAYLQAVEALYGEGDRDTRDFAFADEMRKLSLDNPSDDEASAFYVLALLSTRRAGDTSYPRKQATAAAILESILKRYPGHPGALHYLMHTYDDPEHAPLALDAARKYEKIAVADSNAHAIHMPSHIYAQLGMWPDVARVNQGAFDASPVARRDYHSLEFLQYAQIQMNEYARARATLALGIAGMKLAAAPMAAQFAIETRQWDVLEPFPADSPIPELLFARGLAALEKSGIETAKRNSQTLNQVIQEDLAAMRRVHASTVDLLKKELDSRIALAEKRFADAERLAVEAVQLELRMDLPAELRGIVKPAAEFYGEMLLEIRKPGEAAKQFEASLKQRPGRALSLLGLARATRPQRMIDEREQPQ